MMPEVAENGQFRGPIDVLVPLSFTWRRRTATSWRSASSSISLALSVRAMRTTSWSTRRMARYTRAQSPLRARCPRMRRTVADSVLLGKFLVSEAIEFSGSTGLGSSEWMCTLNLRAGPPHEEMRYRSCP
jgi:hypothetical protein